MARPKGSKNKTTAEKRILSRSKTTSKKTTLDKGEDQFVYENHQDELFVGDFYGDFSPDLSGDYFGELDGM